MCGIAGQHGASRPDEGRRMLARLVHRRPEQRLLREAAGWLPDGLRQEPAHLRILRAHPPGIRPERTVGRATA